MSVGKRFVKKKVNFLTLFQLDRCHVIMPSGSRVLIKEKKIQLNTRKVHYSAGKNSVSFQGFTFLNPYFLCLKCCRNTLK